MGTDITIGTVFAWLTEEDKNLIYSIVGHILTLKEEKILDERLNEKGSNIMDKQERIRFYIEKTMLPNNEKLLNLYNKLDETQILMLYILCEEAAE